MHEYSTDPDVVVRLRDETEWAVRYRRRNVELSPDDAIALQARVELLTAALTEIADCPDVCLNAFDLGNDCPVCLARAALAAGETESEAPSWIRCVCGHSPHKHGDGGTIPPSPTARCHAAHDFDHDCLCEGYRPETESED